MVKNEENHRFFSEKKAYLTEKSMFSKMKKLWLGSNREGSTQPIKDEHEKIKNFFRKINTLIMVGIPASIILSFVLFIAISVAPDIKFISELTHVSYVGEFESTKNELISTDGKALIVVHKGYADYNSLSRIKGISDTDDYQNYLERLETEIQSYLEDGNPVIYLVGKDQYSSDLYPYSQNTAYIITGSSNGFASPIVIDSGSMYEQHVDDIGQLLLDAGVTELNFSGEYGGFCVANAPSNFDKSLFEINLEEDLIYTP